MSSQVCYIERIERGMLPVRFRLVSTRDESSWEFPDVVSDDRAALERGIQEAAEWIDSSVRASGRSSLLALVLDASGARCGWVSTDSTDPAALAAAIQQAAQPIDSEDDGAIHESPPHLALDPDARINGAVSFEPLADEGERDASHGAQALPKRRVGVTLVPDATIRLLLDALDEKGITVGRVVSLWHVLSESFESTGAERADRVVASAETTSAQAIVDVHDGQLLWTWSRSGWPIAAGTIRLAKGMPTEHQAARFELMQADLARLAGEWIGWSTQLGASPGRVRLVVPEDAWTDESSLGASVASVWPGATTDILTEDDPIAFVLERFATDNVDRTDAASRPAIRQLQNRPGRPHRAMYRWGAIAISFAAVVMGVAAFHVGWTAEKARTAADGARTSWRETAKKYSAEVATGQMALPTYDEMAVQFLQTRLQERLRSVKPLAVAGEKPVMQELETLSLVLGSPEYELREISLNEFGVTLSLDVDSTEAYEELFSSLSRISGSFVETWSPQLRDFGDKKRVTLTGSWSDATRTVPDGA